MCCAVVNPHVMVVVITFSVFLQREVVDSIVQGYANKYTIDAKDIAFQVANYSRTYTSPQTYFSLSTALSVRSHK